MAKSTVRQMDTPDTGAFKTAHQSVLEAPGFFDLVVRNIPDLVFVKDEHFRIVMANPAFFNVYPPEMHDKIIGYTTVEEYPQDQAEGFLYHDKVAFEEGESTTVETIDAPKGERITLLTRKIRFENSAGTPYIVCIGRDITHLIEGQQALQASEERYALAVAGSSVGIWDWDLANDDMFWSDRAKEMLGITDPSFKPTTRHFRALVHADDLPLLRQQLGRDGFKKSQIDIEMRVKKSNGGFAWIHLRGKAIRDENGAVKRLAGSVDDITVRRTNQTKLMRSYEQLDEFAYIASHDLKQPLRGIYSLVQFIQEDWADDMPAALNERITKISALASQSERMVANLLEFARISEESESLQTVSLADAAREALTLLPDADAATISIDPALPVIKAEPASIRVLFQNLFSNALKYNDRVDKSIKVGVATGEHANRDGNPVICVQDNGIGIDARSFDKVFKIFSRLHHNDEYGGGSGVGITIVRKIIERHGGEIWLESTPGVGTTFYFTLPTDGQGTA
ncbi:MAG: ATP-binding protein [Pseudomonadota bacterium]